jgi:hypothetical protein
VPALDRHGEQAVVGLQGVAVPENPEVAALVEGHVVRAGDRVDLGLVVAAEVPVRDAGSPQRITTAWS